MKTTTAILLIAGSTTLGLHVSAIENRWIGGGGDNYWTNSLNWSLNEIPSSGHDVVIEDTGTNTVVLSAMAEIQGFRLGGGSNTATLHIVSESLYCLGDTLVETNGVIDLAGILSVDSQTPSDFSFLVKGTINWTAGLLQAQGDTKVLIWPMSGKLNISGPEQKTLSGKLQNVGTISCYASQLHSGISAMLVNEYRLEIHTNLTLLPFGVPAHFHNTGTIVALGGSGLVTLAFGNGWTFTNLSNLRDFPYYATLRAETNSILELLITEPDKVHFESGTVFDGPGPIRFPSTGEPFGWDGAMTLNTTLEFAGSTYYGNTVWTGPGLFKWQGGHMGSFTFGTNFHVEISNPVFMVGSSTNYGSVRCLGTTLHNLNELSFNNHGLFVIETNSTLQMLAFNPSFNNYGTILSKTASLAMNWNFTNYGLVKFDAGKFDANHCTLTTSSVHHVALAGSTPESQFMILNAQSLALSGSLMISLTNGFTPTNGSQFILATYQNVSGQFDTLSLPSLPSNLEWRLRNNTGFITLKVIGPTLLSDITRLPDTSIQFTVNGSVGESYKIEASTNLVDWITLESGSPFNGSIIITDTNTAAFERRFYRGLILD